MLDNSYSSQATARVVLSKIQFKERAPMTDVHPTNHHGHSVAAWTGVIICLIGAVLISFGIGFDQNMMAIIGGIIFVAGGIIGGIMSKAKKKH